MADKEYGAQKRFFEIHDFSRFFETKDLSKYCPKDLEKYDDILYAAKDYDFFNRSELVILPKSATFFNLNEETLDDDEITLNKGQAYIISEAVGAYRFVIDAKGNICGIDSKIFAYLFGDAELDWSY